MVKLIGAYGTLRKGASNHRVLGDSEYITTVELFGYKMYGKRDYPAIIRGAEHESVVLEVYRVKSQKIADDIDFLEGFDRSNPDSLDNLYTLKTIRIDSIGEPIEIYTFDHVPERINQRGPQLKSGDWTKRNQ